MTERMSSPDQSIDDLLGAHRASEESVAEFLIRRYYPKVVRLALSILGDPDEAEDAAQDTVIKAIANLDQYETGTNFNAWLFAIAVNTSRSYLRRGRLRRRMIRLLDAVGLADDSRARPEAIAVSSENSRTLWSAVDRLGEKHRLPIVLKVALDLPVREVAAVLGIPEKTVYSRLYSAFEKLRRDLAGQLGSEDQPSLDRLLGDER